MSLSQKFCRFVEEPMENKSVDALAGIGEVLAKQLQDKGFTKAFHVFGQFLLLGKNKERFLDWLQETTTANSEQRIACFDSVNKYCMNYF